MATYKEQLQARIKSLEERYARIEGSENFANTSEGKLILDWAYEEIGKLFDDLTQEEPLSQEDYRDAHTAIFIYRSFVKMLTQQSAEKKQVERQLEDERGKLAVAEAGKEQK